MEIKSIKNALISVYNKEALEPVLKKLTNLGIGIYSTGGTYNFIKDKGYAVQKVEDLTGYPSILGGRVKTLHPKVFGGILAKRNEEHLEELTQYQIPTFDLVIVDLYPFKQTLAETAEEPLIIEKIDIGGISLIRAAAKNYRDVLVVSDRAQYHNLLQYLADDNTTDLETRKKFATWAFAISSTYDRLIHSYFSDNSLELRYGENPHQSASFEGQLSDQFKQLSGKALSYNNLVDIDAAFDIIEEFWDDDPTIAILKHTNTCGLASSDTLLSAWQKALACDNVSAFGGIIIANGLITAELASEIDKIFYEVLIADRFDSEALHILKAKKNRRILKLTGLKTNKEVSKSCLNGQLKQQRDLKIESISTSTVATINAPSDEDFREMTFGVKAVKHLKSNAIALVKNQQLIGMGCGQTSRIDALKQAIEKADRFGFDTKGAILASDAFFPFADAVTLAHEHGIEAVVQPGGSVRDQESIDFCNDHGMRMVFTGLRHFKH